jgi:hypothetical protein
VVSRSGTNVPWSYQYRVLPTLGTNVAHGGCVETLPLHPVLISSLVQALQGAKIFGTNVILVWDRKCSIL